MEQFIKVEKWMTSLGLSSSELLVFAIIHGFTENSEKHVCTASLEYLAEWSGVSRSQVIRVLKSLVRKGLIEKENVRKNNTNRCNYKSVQDHSINMQLCSDGMDAYCDDDSVNMQLCDSSNMTPCHSVNMQPYKIDNNKIENKDSVCKTRAREDTAHTHSQREDCIDERIILETESEFFNWGVWILKSSCQSWKRKVDYQRNFYNEKNFVEYIKKNYPLLLDFHVPITAYDFYDILSKTKDADKVKSCIIQLCNKPQYVNTCKSAQMTLYTFIGYARC